MTNPFLRSVAGVFSATAGPDEPTIAERICAALARKIGGDTGKRLDPDLWSFVVDQVPGQVGAAAVSGTADLSDPVALASVCLSPAIIASVPGAKTALEGWLGTMPPLSALNSLVVALGVPGEISLSLTLVGQDPSNAAQTVSFRRQDAVIYTRNKAIEANIRGIFGAIKPLSAEPYYCPLQPPP
jgi:hypothetical protein